MLADCHKHCFLAVGMQLRTRWGRNHNHQVTLQSKLQSKLQQGRELAGTVPLILQPCPRQAVFVTLRCNASAPAGPSGCGKSVTLRVLAGALGFEVVEWNAPVPTLWTDYQYQVRTSPASGAAAAAVAAYPCQDVLGYARESLHSSTHLANYPASDGAALQEPVSIAVHFCSSARAGDAQHEHARKTSMGMLVLSPTELTGGALLQQVSSVLPGPKTRSFAYSCSCCLCCAGRCRCWVHQQAG